MMRAAVAVALLGLAPVAVPAQSVVSFEAGRLGFADEGLFQVGIRVATRTPQQVGAEGALAVLPDVGRLALVTDVALSFPVGGDALLVAPRVGVSVIGSGGAAPGAHVGVGIVMRVEDGIGLRCDYTYRRFYAGTEWFPVPSLTVGVALLH